MMGYGIILFTLLTVNLAFSSGSHLSRLGTYEIHSNSRNPWNPENIQCSTSTWDRCVGRLERALGIPYIPADPQKLQEELGELMQSRKGFEKLCSSTRMFVSCLGDTGDACMSMQHLEHLGIALRDIPVFRAQYYELKTECNGAVFTTLDSNYDCLLNVSKKYEHSMKHCVTDLIRELQHDPEHICHYGQEFVACVSKPFKDHCNKQVGNALCQVAQSSLSISMPQCKKLSCNFDDEYSPALLGRNYRVSGKRLEETLLGEPLDQESCNTMALRDCIEDFKTSMGMNSPLPDDPTTPNRHLLKFIWSSKQNFRTYCRAIQKLNKCTTALAESCLSIESVMKLGLSQSNAEEYLRIYKQGKYECGDGYNALYYNHDCIRSKRSEFESQLRHCSMRRTRGDHNSMCSKMPTIANCYKTYMNKCSNKAVNAINKSLRARLC